jgi:hypothetical protein
MYIPPQEILPKFNSDGTMVWDSMTPEYTLDSDIFNFYLNGEFVRREVVQYTDSTKEVICK